MTQDQFADHLNIGRATVYGIEAGNRKVSDSVSAKLARKFEVTPEFLEFTERVKRLEGI